MTINPHQKKKKKLKIEILLLLQLLHHYYCYCHPKPLTLSKTFLSEWIVLIWTQQPFGEDLQEDQTKLDLDTKMTLPFKVKSMNFAEIC